MNVIYCTSPFQVLVAERIITEVNEPFFGVYVGIEGDISERYSDKLKNACGDGIYLSSQSQMSEVYAYFEDKYGSIDKFYLASIDSVKALAFAKRYGGLNKLYTFDDGSTSVFDVSMYTRDGVIFENKTLKDIRNSVIKHYTIYDEIALYPLEKVVKLDLGVKPEGFKRATNGKTLRVLIGQSLTGDSDFYSMELSKQYSMKAVNKYGIDLYYPHPRNKIDIPNKTVNAKKCFEEEIYDLLSKYEYVEVYHFWSTVALNVKDIPGVDVIGISTPISKFGTKGMLKLNMKYERLM